MITLTCNATNLGEAIERAPLLIIRRIRTIQLENMQLPYSKTSLLLWRARIVFDGVHRGGRTVAAEAVVFEFAQATKTRDVWPWPGHGGVAVWRHLDPPDAWTTLWPDLQRNDLVLTEADPGNQVNLKPYSYRFLYFTVWGGRSRKFHRWHYTGTELFLIAV